MRRGVQLLLMVALVMSGFSPCVTNCACCHVQSHHACCAQGPAMHAGCPSKVKDSSGTVPQAQAEKQTQTGLLVSATAEDRNSSSANSAVEVAQRPPGLLQLPLVLRT
jgi:hypothetical protein